MHRIKCSGDRPCRQCTSAQRDCLYPEPVEKVTIPRTELESLQRRCAWLECQLATIEPRQHLGSPPASSRADVATDAPYVSGDSQHAAFRLACIDSGMRADGAGISRHPGETSRATFLDEIKGLIMLLMPLVCLPREPRNAVPAECQYETHETHDSRPIRLPPKDAITLPLPRECPYVPRPLSPHAPSSELTTPRGIADLRRISDYLVYSGFREAGLPDLPTRPTVPVAEALEMLEDWHVNLPPDLQLPADPLTLIPVGIFTQASSFGQGPAGLLSGAANFGQDRACWTLHIYYNQVSPPARRLSRRPLT